jgi:UDP-N-acetylmuramoyl-tripeptide--D-alanyl-D-alanine ligase
MNALWSGADLSVAVGAAAAFEAHGVSIDTRTLQPGDLFVALMGEHGDGHGFIADALAKGAAGALAHRAPDGVDPAKLLMVSDTLAGLQALGDYGRGRFAGRVVAVTGSVGKTTTKEMLRAALSSAGPAHAAEASYNNHWGVPLTLARLPPAAAFCVCEIGMNHAGEILPLTRMARPHVTVITSVERVHIGHLGSIEAIAIEKASIRLGLLPDGISVLPADSEQLPLLLAGLDGPMRLFGSGDNADVHLLDSVSDGDGNSVTVNVRGKIARFRMAAPGRHMAMNAAAALAVADALGLDIGNAAAALQDFAPVFGRGARRQIAVAGGAALLIDESYNASAVSVRAALAVLALQPGARRIAVLGDMLELGAEGPAEHVSLLSAVASSADLLFTCGPLMRTLSESASSQLRGAHAFDSAALAPVVAAALRPGDVVLVKGSLGSRMKRIVSALDLPSESR